MAVKIENQIERFAPGFKDLVVGRNLMPPSELEKHNANLIGGDINGGAADLRQLFFRPTRQDVRDFSEGTLPLLCVHPARRRCTWNVWIFCRP